MLVGCRSDRQVGDGQTCWWTDIPTIIRPTLDRHLKYPSCGHQIPDTSYTWNRQRKWCLYERLYLESSIYRVSNRCTCPPRHLTPSNGREWPAETLWGMHTPRNVVGCSFSRRKSSSWWKRTHPCNSWRRLILHLMCIVDYSFFSKYLPAKGVHDNMGSVPAWFWVALLWKINFKSESKQSKPRWMMVSTCNRDSISHKDIRTISTKRSHMTAIAKTEQASN